MEQHDTSSLPPDPAGGNTRWFRILTFGHFQIDWVDPETQQITPFPPERSHGQNAATALGVLKALLSCPDRFATRSWLLEQFWPNSRQHTAEERLTDVISSLRGLLRPEGNTDMLVHFIHATGTSSKKRGAGFRLDASPKIWCDADAFEWYVKHGMLLDQRGQDSTACWERAYTLAERGIYLPEQIEEDWTRPRRDYLNGLLRDCVQRWTQLLREAGYVDEAIMRLRSYWLEHLTDEDALRPLLDILGERERFKEAEEYYAKTRAALAEDGHVPDDHTNEAIEAVRALKIKRFPLEGSPASVPRASFPPDQHRIIEAVMLFCEEQELDNTNRRRFLQQLFQLVGTAALPTIPLHASAETMYHERVSKETVTLYEHVLALSWEQYYTVNARYAAQHLADWLRSLTDLLSSAPLAEQRALLSLLSRFYQLSGVAARDRMDLAQARHDGKLAVELAFHLEDAELLAASLFRLAKTLLKLHQSQEALEHLETACVYARRARAPLKGYVYQATAEVTALAAHTDRPRQYHALLLLDQAQQVLATAEVEDDGSFVKFNVAGLALDRAGALIHFGQFQEARSALDAARVHLATDVPRWQTRLLLADARISLAENDLEACCGKAMEALSILHATQSRSGLLRITSLYQQLSATSSHHAMVQTLGEQLLVGK